MYKASLINDVIQNVQSTHAHMYTGPVSDLSQDVNYLASAEWDSILKKLRYIKEFKRFSPSYEHVVCDTILLIK